MTSYQQICSKRYNVSLQYEQKKHYKGAPGSLSINIDCDQFGLTIFVFFLFHRIYVFLTSINSIEPICYYNIITIYQSENVFLDHYIINTPITLLLSLWPFQ